MPASFLISRPGRHGFLFKALPGFLAINILLNRLVHDPVGGALTLLGKLLHTFF